MSISFTMASCPTNVLSLLRWLWDLHHHNDGYKCYPELADPFGIWSLWLYSCDINVAQLYWCIETKTNIYPHCCNVPLISIFPFLFQLFSLSWLYWELYDNLYLRYTYYCFPYEIVFHMIRLIYYYFQIAYHNFLQYFNLININIYI